MMPPPPAIAFSSFLLPGERVLWTGRPKQGLALHQSDTLMLPFSLLWLSFAVYFFLILAPPSADDIGIGLTAIFFLLSGVYFVFGRFFQDAMIRRRTTYAVTDQRIIFARDSRKFTSIDVRRLPRLELAEHNDGTGTISFDASPALFHMPRKNSLDAWIPSRLPVQFFKVQDHRRAYQLIRENAGR